MTQAGQFGDERRNEVLGPGYGNVDLLMLKTFEISEHWAAQFAAECSTHSIARILDVGERPELANIWPGPYGCIAGRHAVRRQDHVLTYRHSVAASSVSNFDLVIADHFLSGATGTEISRAMKSVKPDVPILILSGEVDVPSGIEFANGYLSKGEGPDVLLDVIALMLAT